MSAVGHDRLVDRTEPDLSCREGGLLAQHDQYFSTVLANTLALRRKAYALRFQVYCLERQFENAEEHPDGLETDSYDAHAAQGVLFHRPTRSAMGAVRAIFARPGTRDTLPIEALLRASSLDISDYVDLSQTIEISRFAISKELRRRKSDQLDTSEPSHTDGPRQTNLAFLSLLQFVLRECAKHNILFWTAVMEPKFLRLLARMGITYTPVGPLVIHHGIRQPCYCYLPQMLENARLAQPRCWQVLTDGGWLHEKIAAIARTPALV